LWQRAVCFAKIFTAADVAAAVVDLQLNLDTRLFYCTALSFTDDDYTQAQV
jgi:hypothetical protein